MPALVEYLSVGHQSVPGVALTCVPRAAPTAAALYRARLDAVQLAAAPYVCFIDGYGDLLLPGFVAAMEDLAGQGLPMGYAAELVRGKRRQHVPWTLQGYLADHTIVHHGVVCRRADLVAIDWPAGCHLWEIIAYGTLAQGGVAFDPVPRYDWRPGANGARLWSDTQDAIRASKAWLRRGAGDVAGHGIVGRAEPAKPLQAGHLGL
ncbi:MAG: hypothetical protein RL268_506 [Pseudomonadota bacterium]